MHLAGPPAMRSDRAITMEVRRVGGGTERRSLRYPDPIVVD